MPTIREDVSPVGFCLPRSTPRTYLLCERHNDDYFARSGFLHRDRAERIKAELIPKDPDA